MSPLPLTGENEVAYHIQVRNRFRKRKPAGMTDYEFELLMKDNERLNEESDEGMDDQSKS
jgi:hypothetical protein